MKSALGEEWISDVSHGGWCPKGRKAEDGRIPDKYLLKETSSADYLKRTDRMSWILTLP